jgi:hypothetical protein
MPDEKNNLTAPFRADQIRTRQGRNGQAVSYIEIVDVIDRLNSALPAWSFEVVSHVILDDEVVVHARLRAGDVVKEDFGTHEITRSKNGGAAVCIGENIKAAASDALKRTARLLGVGLELWRGHTEGDPRPVAITRYAGQLATEAQMSKVRSLAAQKRVDLDVVVFDRFGVAATDLSKSDASTLIDELLGKNNGARVNGHAHRHA